MKIHLHVCTYVSMRSRTYICVCIDNEGTQHTADTKKRECSNPYTNTIERYQTNTHRSFALPPPRSQQTSQYVQTHMHTHTHINTHTCIQTNPWTQSQMQTQLEVQARSRAQAQTNMQTHTRATYRWKSYYVNRPERGRWLCPLPKQ